MFRGSDAFLADLAIFAARGEDAIVAGDLNQAWGYDAEHPGHVCGAEFFAALERAGYVDVTDRDWGGVERPTRLNPDYQLTAC